MTFDRMLYIDRLKEAGVDEPVARAQAEALRDALFETVATKTDLEALAATTKADLKDLAATTKAELKELATSVDRIFDAVDSRIELTARDLVVKGASGLVILAGLMISLKLFG